MSTIKVTTLGTSHGDHTVSRFNSSTLIEIDQNLYLIDAGSPVDGLLIRKHKKVNNLKAVFITHMHNDHVGGLPSVYKAFIKYPSPDQHLDIFLPEHDGIDALAIWLKAQHLPYPSKCVRVHTVDPNNAYTDDNISFQAIRTRHMIDNADKYPSYAYLIKADDTRVLYSGDLSYDFSDFPQIAADNPCDLCICECTHFDMEKALKILADCPIRRIVFNHVADPWHGDGEQKLVDLAKRILPFPFAIANDGDEFMVGGEK